MHFTEEDKQIVNNQKTFSSIIHCEVRSLSRVRLFMTPWTVAYHAPLSMGFSRQEYWSGLPFPFQNKLQGWRMYLEIT